MEYLGIDVGGTTTTGIRLENNLVKASTIVPTDKKNVKDTIETIARVIQELITDNTQAIGIGIPGHYDLHKESIIFTPNLPLKNVRLKEILQKKFKLPIHIDNDANCFALHWAHEQGDSHLVGLTLGTGVGCGIVIDGVIYHGQNFAGEISRIPQPPTTATQKYKHILYRDTTTIRGILDMAKKQKITVASPKELQNSIDRETQSDLKKRKEYVYQVFGETLGHLIVYVNQMCNPQTIVIGGGLAKAWKFFSPEMKQIIKKYSTIPIPKILVSKDPHAGAKGAAYLCR